MVVGGRAFAESGMEGRQVGADLASLTSENLDRRFLAGSAAQATAEIHVKGS